MIEPRWRKVGRDLWLHRARLALVVPAIAVGLVGGGSVLDTWALVERATRLGYAASNPASATIRTDSIDAPLLAQVRALPGIADAQARRTVRAAVRSGARTAIAELFTADDLTAIRIGRVEPEAGAWPPADGALVVERSSVDFAGVSVGDVVTVAAAGGDPMSLDVIGVARDVGLAPGWMEHIVYGFVTQSTLRRLGLPAALDELRIRVRDRGLDQAAVRRIAFEVANVVERAGHRVVDVGVPVPGQHIHSGQMNTLLYAQAAFGVLALVLAAFLVANLITAMLSGQVREIGVMKAIGARPGQLAGMYLGMALALGALATGLALPAAAMIGRRYGAFKAELLNFEVEGYAIPAGVIAVQALVGLLVPVLAAAVPVARGCRMSVAEALRHVGIPATDGVPGLWLGRTSGLTRLLLLSLRGPFRRRRRTAVTLVTLAMGGAVFLGARSLRISIRRGLDRAFAPLRYDLLVRLRAPHAVDSLEGALAGLAGVEGAEAWTGASATRVEADGTLGNAFRITAPPADTRLFAPSLTDGRWPRAGARNELVVSRGLARTEGLVVGGVITLMIGGRPTSWAVVGVADGTVASPAAFADRGILGALTTGGRATAIAVAMAPAAGPASRLELVQRIRGALDGAGLEVAGSTLTEESRRVTEDHLLTVAQFLGVMAWIVVVVGGLGLASTMSLAVLERTREIGVLRAIGARHRTILVMVLVEGLAIGGMSWLVAIPLAAPMSVILARVFGRTMLSVPVTWLPDAAGVGAWLGLVVVVSLLASAGPARRATRVPTAEALAYE